MLPRVQQVKKRMINTVLQTFSLFLIMKRAQCLSLGEKIVINGSSIVRALLFFQSYRRFSLSPIIKSLKSIVFRSICNHVVTIQKNAKWLYLRRRKKKSSLDDLLWEELGVEKCCKLSCSIKSLVLQTMMKCYRVYHVFWLNLGKSS